MNKLFTLFTLLLLLPLAARAAGNPTTLTVGGTDVLSGGYWTTDAESGTLTATESTTDYNVHYDGYGTLTLKDATINGTNTTGHVGAGIYAEGDLTIVLEGSSTVTGVVDPNGESQSIRVSGNLTIRGGGSLTAQGANTTSDGGSYGIFVIGSFTQQSGSVTASGGNVSANRTSEGLYVYGSTVTVERGTLTATGGNTSGNSNGIYARGSVTVGSAAVTATGGTGNYSYGLYIDSSSPSVTLSGGSLTARSGSATSEAVGIYVQNLLGSAASVTVGNGSTLLTNSVILYDNSFTEKPLAPTGNGSWLIYGQSNQPSAVGGTYTLEENITIESGNTLTIPAGSTLDLGGYTLTNNGTLTIANQSSLAGEGTLAGESGSYTMTNPDLVISGDTALTYDGTDHFTDFSLTAPTDSVEVMGQSFTISNTPSLEGWSLDKLEIINAGDYTLTAKNGTRTIEKEVTVKPATISITSATVQDKIYNGTTDATVTGVTFNGLVEGDSLISGTDYTASAEFTDKNAADNKTATVTVNLKENGNYTFANGEKTATANATAKISPLPVELDWGTTTTFTYDGNLKTVIATVTNLVVGDEITLTYEGNTGTAVSSYTAKVIWLSANNYTLDGATGTEQVWSIVGVPIADATVELSEDEFTYTGSEQKPKVTAVTLDEKALTKDTDYTVTYSDKSINAGKYTVTVTGTGNYSGTATATYTITPAALTITGATLASKTYDGTTNATVESVTFNGLVNSESLTLNTDYTATAVFDDANAGTDKSATVTVTLSNGNYSLATSTYTLENQTIVQAVFGGTTEISGSVLANWPGEVTLPAIPDGASYGTPTSSDVTGLSITDGNILHYTGGSGVTSEETYTITVPVTGATNYFDYNITVTLTGKEIVTVEAEGSKNPSFFTTQDRFTLTATVSGENLSENPDCWTWDIADKTVADFIDSPTTRSMSVSDSRTFEIKGPGTTTITATYDDGTYRGSVDFTVRISKPTTPDPDPVSYYNIYVEEVCDGVEVSTSKQAVKEGGSITVYVEKDTAHYTFDNFHVYYKEGYYGPWVELPEGVQPGEYPIKNIWNHIYIKAEGAEEKEDPTGIEQIEGVKVYTKDGSLYVQTPQREQVIIVSMSGAVVKNEEQIGLKQYHGLQPGIYIVRVGDRAYKLRLH